MYASVVFFRDILVVSLFSSINPNWNHPWFSSNEDCGEDYPLGFYLWNIDINIRLICQYKLIILLSSLIVDWGNQS